ncbi:carbohydrate kinase [Nostoc sp. FACHB-87]|uniref:carbohydrate kinase family protein n=1 Tax=Nostocaceae TaxID=1162 RepID=UPI001687D4F5|nr:MULTISPECIES: carbohydrate kinase [Nostocaceae]MBD2303242.1 carbohydrate kinase [Nostoc sp. FACHB-190]MBD2458288.1 carbohydrate kinase [Nostoc sp. FACHB-87]MBD2480074.1 carbohydrate kinase [Anabaena sp. FACHB-83]
MKNPRVICIGEMLFDRFSVQVDESLQQVTSWQDSPGGAPANTACALVKLGIPTAFIGCIAQDELGELLINLLKDSGVDCTGVQRHHTAPTRIVYLLRDKIGNSNFIGFGGRDPAEFADAYLCAELLPIYLFKEVEWLVLGTLELAYTRSREAIYKAISLAKFYDIKIFVDINWEPMFWRNPDTALHEIKELIKYVNFLKLTVDEAKFLFGTTEPKAIAQSLSNLKGVLVTASERGCTYYLGEYEGNLPSFSVEAIDTKGAGDAFNAGIICQILNYGIHCLADPEIIREIVTYASAVGAITTTKLGAITAQPTLIEVEAFLSNHCLKGDSIS